ncbi:glycoside hydrolase family 15 protein [Nafulsella turpanensis]|uniref:glycoside hydrolase family 15 protein n=1 Tax=Nafulsella turpanensis TaxID=1265690 RepID=UPI00034B1965|nr:glycoside hydrolase family 15 protein [Nafulsella turpanensis]
MSLPLKSLAFIGDRRTMAAVSKTGSICWYCPGRFDNGSLFASLLDEEKGGEWSIKWHNSTFKRRDYEEDSAILISLYQQGQEVNVVTDFMPAGKNSPQGICRMLEASAAPCTIQLQPAPDFGREKAVLVEEQNCIRINDRHFFYSSFPAQVVEDRIEIQLDSLTRGWMFLSEGRLKEAPAPEKWLDNTRAFWKKIADRFSYYGPYEAEVAQSIRAIRMLTYEESGGILAAGTTSLPELVGGDRNYDYRYVWLRDAGMIVSALTRAGSNGVEERRFLKFICGLEPAKGEEGTHFAPMYTAEQKLLPKEQVIELKGYLNSRPVMVGNGARNQLQLGTTANILLAAKLIYNKYDTREHWEVMAATADFLADSWHREDHGIWEEKVKKHYTSSKVIVACGLMFIAKHTKDAAQKKKWKKAEKDIRLFVKENCLNAEGAYAAAAGEECVDISAILFPAWAYTEIDAPEVKATVKVLERDYKKGLLYRRHLFDADSGKEGAFLAGSLWMAQYYIYLKELDKARKIIDETLQYTTDLGFFSEEADVEHQRMIGNIPQTFVHASFIGAVIDLKHEMEKKKSKDPVNKLIKKAIELFRKLN